MIKAKKGLLLSVFSLILALVITTSSTYAWFAMNTTVSATNMQITARADSSFLVIEKTASGTGDFVGKIGNINDATLAIPAQAEQNPAVNDFAVLPVTYKNLGSGSKWYTAIGQAYDNGAPTLTDPEDSNSTPVYNEVSDTNGYVGKFTFVIGLNPYVSKINATNLKVSSLTYANPGNSVFFPALSVLVKARDTKTGTTAEDIYLGSDNTNRTTVAGTGTVLASTIDHDGSPIEIEVYVFINGDNAAITTQNAVAANLTSFTVAINFTCTGANA